jgi:hypothetical protein
MGRPRELSISDGLGRTRKKILKGKSKPHLAHLMNISLTVVRNNGLALIQSALERRQVDLL